jgi:hypothetical protein
MQTSQEVAKLFKSLCECKKDFVPLSKNKKGYGYSYTPLDSVIDMLNTVLPKHGINFVQFPSTIGDNYALTTRIFHESGEWMEDTIIFSLTEISKANDTQKLGASITYFRRYALSAIFGIASDEDIDGNIEMNIAAKQSQSYAQRKTFNESKPQPQPQQQNQNALSQNKQKSDVQTLQQTNIFIGDYNGVPLTDDDEINNEIKKIVDEVYLNTQIVDEKRKAYILKKKSEIDSKETYISFLRRMEKSIKQKIDEESKSSDIESEAKE